MNRANAICLQVEAAKRARIARSYSSALVRNGGVDALSRAYALAAQRDSATISLMARQSMGVELQSDLCVA